MLTKIKEKALHIRGQNPAKLDQVSPGASQKSKDHSALFQMAWYGCANLSKKYPIYRVETPYIKVYTLILKKYISVIQAIKTFVDFRAITLYLQFLETPQNKIHIAGNYSNTKFGNINVPSRQLLPKN